MVPLLPNSSGVFLDSFFPTETVGPQFFFGEHEERGVFRETSTRITDDT